MITKWFAFLAVWTALTLSEVRADDLTCWILVTAFKPKPDQTLPAELILKNTGSIPVRICTLCMEWKSLSKGTFDVMLSPKAWKSDPPTKEMSAQSVVSIQPGSIAHIPFDISTYDTLGKDHQVRVTASYGVSTKFADRLHVWSGVIKAEPVDIKIE